MHPGYFSRISRLLCLNDTTWFGHDSLSCYGRGEQRHISLLDKDGEVITSVCAEHLAISDLL